MKTLKPDKLSGLFEPGESADNFDEDALLLRWTNQHIEDFGDPISNLEGDLADSIAFVTLLNALDLDNASTDPLDEPDETKRAQMMLDSAFKNFGVPRIVCAPALSSTNYRQNFLLLAALFCHSDE